MVQPLHGNLKADGESENHRSQTTESIADVFKNSDAQGLAVIQKNLASVLLYPAPGIADVSVVKEHLAAAFVVLRGEILLGEKLNILGVDLESRSDEWRSQDPILVLEYSGPKVQSQPFSIPPAYGIPALFLLLSLLHAAQAVPGVDSKRILAQGGMALARSASMSLLPLWLSWFFLVAIYSIGMKLFFSVSLDAQTFISLLGLSFYSISLGGLLAICGKRHLAPWLFVPWLLLNMTIGGGLWNVGTRFDFLLPVSSVVNAHDSGFQGACLIFASSAVCLICGAFACAFLPPKRA
jgi:hypothetical protein